MKYRAEIDGLRALAVIPVILFHAGFGLFAGGFVGVDVFFVISGYLITTILVEDIEKKRFSIINFYERRARRILPALYFVMLACIPFAWMWMLPNQMLDFSKSLIAVSLFASNFLFWRQSNYFDPSNEEQPLLHTWSLAVEEQYYLIFPIFLFLTWRLGKSHVFWMIFVIATISLLLSEWGWRNYLTANFYLAPTRAWELLAGSIAAFIVQKNGVKKNNGLALIGLAAIFFAIFVYDERTPFPSLYTLVPVLGVVLLVLYADKETFAAKLLSSKALVGIGLISYSAYLWHQPLFAFARLRLLEHPPDSLMVVLSLISIALAYLSWKYVEAPFRSKKRSRRSIFIFSGIGLVFFISLGSIFLPRQQLLTEEQARIYPNGEYALREGEMNWNECLNFGGDHRNDFIENPCKYSSVDNTSIWQDSVILAGDSHAQVLHYDLASLSKSQLNYVLYAGGGCPPFIGDNFSNACSDFHRDAINYALQNLSVKAVVLSARWASYVRSETYQFQNNIYMEMRNPFGSNEESEIMASRQIEQMIEKFLNQNIPVIFVSDYPTNGVNIYNTFLKSIKFDIKIGDRADLMKSDYDNYTRPVFNVLDKFSDNDKFFVVNSYSTVCGDSELCKLATEKEYLLGDTNHASPSGRVQLAKEITRIIDSLSINESEK